MNETLSPWELERLGRLKLSKSGDTPIPDTRLEVRGAPVTETSHEYRIRKSNAED